MYNIRCVRITFFDRSVYELLVSPDNRTSLIRGDPTAVIDTAAVALSPPREYRRLVLPTSTLHRRRYAVA